MEADKERGNAIKKALEQRNGDASLPSNFNYMMMRRIRMEAEKRRRRRRLVVSCLFVLAVCALLLLGAYTLKHYADFDLLSYFSGLAMKRADSGAVGFYVYIGSLVLLLLGLDYRIRHHKRKKAG